MKKHLRLLGLLIPIIMIIVTGCGKVESYGQPISSETITTNIKEMLTSPEKYEDKTIKLEGKIGQVCPTGCWFFLQDDTGETMIDIKPAGLAIPKRTGKQAIVEGVVTQNHNGQFMFFGKGVEIK